MEKWYNQKIEEIEQKLETNKEKGITNEEAKKRQEKYGLNELKAKKKKSILQKFMDC